MDEKYNQHVVIVGRDENGPAIDVEALMSGTGESLDTVITDIEADGAQADMSGFAKSEQAKGRTKAEVLADVQATAKGKDAAFVAKVAGLLK